VDKPNDALQGADTVYITSAALNNLLPFSQYSVTVTAHTVKDGTDSTRVGKTLELGNLNSLFIMLVLKGRKKSIHFYIAFGVDVRNPRRRETVCVFTVTE
jgi:hypothetical protein